MTYQTGRTLWTRKGRYHVLIKAEPVNHRLTTVCGVKALGWDDLRDLLHDPVWDEDYDCKNCKKALKH